MSQSQEEFCISIKFGEHQVPSTELSGYFTPQNEEKGVFSLIKQLLHKIDVRLPDEITTLEELIDRTVTEHHHKTTLTIWKGLVEWLETSARADCNSYPKYLIKALQLTLSKYLTWNLADPNVFKIAKFLTACYLKIVKHCTEEELAAITRHNVQLMYQVLRASTPTLGTGTREFLLMVRRTLQRYTRYTAAECGTDRQYTAAECGTDRQYTAADCGTDRQYHVTRLVAVLDTLTFPQLHLVFGNLEHCAVDVAEGLSVVLDNGRLLSVIHYAILRVCGLCTECSSREQLAVLEKVLVVNLLSYSSLCAAVSANSLVFLSRLVPVAYVKSLVTLLSGLVRKVNCTIQSSNIKCTIKRLLPLLDEQSTNSVMTSFASPGSRLLELAGDEQAVRTADVCKQVIQQWKSGDVSSERLYGVVLAEEDVTCLSRDLIALLKPLSESRYKEAETRNVYELLVQCLLSVRAHWKSYRNSHSLLQVCQEIERLLIFEDVYLSSLVTDILVSVSSYQCPQDKMYCTVIVRIWKKLFSTPDPFSLQKNIFSLATFARMTPHPQILSALAQDAKIKGALSAHLRQRVDPTLTYLPVGTCHISLSDVASLRDFPHPITIRSILKELETFDKIPLNLKRHFITSG